MEPDKDCKMSDIIRDLCITFHELKRIEKEIGLTPKYVVVIPLSDFNTMITDWLNEGMAFGL